jgi:hypothetical protein
MTSVKDNQCIPDEKLAGVNDTMLSIKLLSPVLIIISHST